MTAKRSTVLPMAAIILFVAVLSAVVFSGCLGGGAGDGDTVSVRYIGTFENGTVFDSNTGDDGKAPLNFTIGQNHVIPGFEKAVIGMNINETKTVTIPPEDAYPYRSDYVAPFNRTIVVESLGRVPEVGDKLPVIVNTGATIVGTITDVTPTEIIIDLNDETAGKTLIFEITVVDIVKGGSQ